MHMSTVATNQAPQHTGSPITDAMPVTGNHDAEHNTQLKIAPTPPSPSHVASPPQDEPDTPSEERRPRSRSRSAVRLLLALSPTLTLENSGSVARDHLASERTWLAYVRTSLAIASTGVALVQLFTISVSESRDSDPDDEKNVHIGETLQRFARPLGATTVLLALIVLAIGVQRYFKIQNAMTEGHFPVARSTVVFITAVLAAIVAVTFGILIAVPRRS